MVVIRWLFCECDNIVSSWIDWGVDRIGKVGVFVYVFLMYIKFRGKVEVFVYWYDERCFLCG